MQIIFVGGPWHGKSRSHADPVPARIEAGPDAGYLAWDRHPATAGVLAEALRCAHPYVLETLMPPYLLERVQDLLLHGPVSKSVDIDRQEATPSGVEAVIAPDAHRVPEELDRDRGAAA